MVESGAALPPDLTSVMGMTELEESLLAAGGPALAEKLLARLAAADESIAGEMQQGLSPGEYEIGRLARTALAAAQEIVLLFRKPV